MNNMYPQFCATHYDTSLSALPGLTWLPWVGSSYPVRGERNRLLLVGESHYTNDQDAVTAAAVKQRLMNTPGYTRDIVSECCVEEDWYNPTLSSAHKLLFRENSLNRETFWSDTCFYNFVQRPMWYQAESPERPNEDDFVVAWAVFLELVKVLRPSHCLFIGVAASNHFDWAMTQRQAKIRQIAWTEKVGRAYGRVSHVEVDDHAIALHFVKHAGSFFSWSAWNDYLHRQVPDLMQSLSDPRYILPSPLTA